MKNSPYFVLSNICPMFSSSMVKKSLVTGLSLSLSQLATAQDPLVVDAIVVESGILFGAADDDPLIWKTDPASKDLRLDLATNGAFSIFSNEDINATFKAGQGNSATVEAGKWYRIAKTSGDQSALRASALFNLKDTASFSHSNVTFRTGMSFSASESMNFTLLSNSGLSQPVFGEVRYLSATTNDEFYLEVKILRDADVSYSIMENLADGGWQPVDWLETVSIPADYIETAYDLNKLFISAGQTPVLSVDRTEGVAVTGGLTVNGRSVVTQQHGAGGSAIGDYAFSVGLGNQANGDYSLALGIGSHADGEASTALGANTFAFGEASIATGSNTIISQHSAAVFGQFNQDIGTGSNNAWIGDNSNSVFEVGVGISDSDRKNALTIMQDGTIELGKDQNNEVPLKVNSDGSVILNKAQGDVSMGIYGQ